MDADGHGSGFAVPAPSILGAVCRRCVDELGVTHATVVLATDDGLWAPAHASSAVAAQLEQLAYTLGESPWLDALQRHAPVLVGDLDDRVAARRWPVWSASARALGVRSVAAFPIQAGAVVAGVLTLLSDVVDVVDGKRVALALRLADIALLGVLDVLAGLNGAGPDTSDDIVDLLLAEPPEIADVVRAEVHQAAGVVMAQTGLPIAVSLARLRARSFHTGRPLADVAADVVARRIRFDWDEDSTE